MEPVEALKAEFDRVVAAKAERRRRMAALPFLEKVRILVQMQRMTAPLTRGKNPRARVWDLPPEEGPAAPPAATATPPPDPRR